MTEINQLCENTSPQPGDLIPIWSSQQGQTQKASLTAIIGLLQTMVTAIDDKITQYAAPSATGQTVAVNDNNQQSVWLILTPVAAYAAMTLVLPPAASSADRREVLVNTTQAVTALTVSSVGATVIGAPTTLAANASFRMRFDLVTKTWYKV